MDDELQDIDTQDWDLTIPFEFAKVVKEYLELQVSPTTLSALRERIEAEAYDASLRIRQAIGIGGD